MKLEPRPKLEPKAKPLIERGKDVPRGWSEEEIETICKEASTEGVSLREVSKKYNVPGPMVLGWLDQRRQCLEYAKQEVEWSLIAAIKEDLKAITNNAKTIEPKIQKKLEDAVNKEGKSTSLKEYIDLTKLQIQRVDVLIKLAEKGKLNLDFLQSKVNPDVQESVTQAAQTEKPVEPRPQARQERQASERLLKLVADRVQSMNV